MTFFAAIAFAADFAMRIQGAVDSQASTGGYSNSSAYSDMADSGDNGGYRDDPPYNASTGVAGGGGDSSYSQGGGGGGGGATGESSQIAVDL